MPRYVLATDRGHPPYELDLEVLAASRVQADAETSMLSGPGVPVARVQDTMVGGVSCRVYDPRPEDTVARPGWVHPAATSPTCPNPPRPA